MVVCTGRVVSHDKHGAVPAHMPPIIRRLGLNHEEWLEIVQWRLSRTSVGATVSLRGRYR